VDERWKVISLEADLGGIRFDLYRRSYVAYFKGEIYRGPSKIDLDSGAQIANLILSSFLLRAYTKGGREDYFASIRSLVQDGVSPAKEMSLEKVVKQFLNSSTFVFRLKSSLGNLTVRYNKWFTDLQFRNAYFRGSRFPLLLLAKYCQVVKGNWVEFRPVLVDGTQLPKVSFWVPRSALRLASFIVETCGAEGLRRFITDYEHMGLEKVLETLRGGYESGEAGERFLVESAEVGRGAQEGA